MSSRTVAAPMLRTGETRTTCPYCGVGCGVIVSRGKDRHASVEILGDPSHPANFGRLCSKGAALGETLGADDRLLTPRIDGQGSDWDTALDAVARGFADTIERHGPDAVAMYVSGQLLTEDYYVANKLMKGYIGTANIDTNSRLCMASSVAGHRRAFGSDTVPGVYADLEQADLVVLVGSNLAWCHPVLFQRLQASREARGTRVVVIDPARTVTAESADLHLAIEPGSDVALFAGLLAWLDANGRVDSAYTAAHVSGLDAALDVARATAPTDIARITGLEWGDIAAFYADFADTHRTVTVYSQGVNQSSAGTDKVNAIINVHLATGRIGKPGCGPFSVTGQPNAMGGREVGGLANQLAAHLDLESAGDRELLQAFWSSPRMASRPGYTAVELFEAVADGEVRALWVMATNPSVSLPRAAAVDAALARCDFLVVSDVVLRTDTARHAKVLLPASAWGEKDGTVTNSERRISRQRAFRPAAGQARPDWWAICEVARRMGFSGFDFASAAAIFREYAALTGAGNGGSRDLDLSGLAHLDDACYDALAPVQWPVRSGARIAQFEAPPANAVPDSRFFADGGFFTDDGLARCVPTAFRAPAARTTPARPFILNTGRIRDQWHTMTRTGAVPRLSAHRGEPFCELNAVDAARIGVPPAGLVRVTSAVGAVTLRALTTQRQLPGRVFAAMHWSDEFASNARVDSLVEPHLDPYSGQPEFKHTPVSLISLSPRWYAFAACRTRPDSHALQRLCVGPNGYWALARAERGWRMELAGDAHESALTEDLAEVLSADGLSTVSYLDASVRQRRFGWFTGDRLDAMAFVSPVPVAAARSWLLGLLGERVPDAARFAVLAARASDSANDDGALVCACVGVGTNRIADAVARGAATVDAVGAATGAGTQCGSCRPEVARLCAMKAECTDANPEVAINA